MAFHSHTCHMFSLVFRASWAECDPGHPRLTHVAQLETQMTVTPVTPLVSLGSIAQRVTLLPSRGVTPLAPSDPRRLSSMSTVTDSFVLTYMARNDYAKLSDIIAAGDAHLGYAYGNHVWRRTVNNLVLSGKLRIVDKGTKPYAYAYVQQKPAMLKVDGIAVHVKALADSTQQRNDNAVYAIEGLVSLPAMVMKGCIKATNYSMTDNDVDRADHLRALSDKLAQNRQLARDHIETVMNAVKLAQQIIDRDEFWNSSSLLALVREGHIILSNETEPL